MSQSESLMGRIDEADHRFSQNWTPAARSSFEIPGDDSENQQPQFQDSFQLLPSSGQGATPLPRMPLGPSNSFSSSCQSPMGALGTPVHRTFSQGQLMGDFGDFTPGSQSILGRRQRTDSMDDWSPSTKARLKLYAADMADEYSVSESGREEFIRASQLPTHKLLIITLAAVLGKQDDATGERKLLTYLVSSDFKENVINQIRGVLLDPKLPSYKIGFLDRLMRHIRLNPGDYRIPQEYRNMITTKLFNSFVSKAATGARADMKRKMFAAWGTKTNIYDLVKSLAWKSSQEMTDAIWGRFAWVQMKLVDYKKAGGKDDGFWDSIDKELAERRNKALTMPIASRPAFISFIFEESLKTHMQHCKPAGRKRKSSTQLPKWQQDISRAVEEMESYTQEELAEEEIPEDEGEENAGTPVEP